MTTSWTSFKKELVLLVLLFIITIPAFASLLNNAYFTMHDDQHIARLFLLDQGMRQGSLYPRWVDVLGFGYGYPLFNFYPPLIYYVAELFHLAGASFIWSIKLLIIAGFVIGALGMYLLANKLMTKQAAFVSAVLFTFFRYKAVLVFVRGALAEFFALSLLPFVFLSFYNLYKKSDLKHSIFFGISFALIILTHPFVAVPSLMFIGLLFIFFIVKHIRHPGKRGTSVSRISWRFWSPPTLGRGPQNDIGRFTFYVLFAVFIALSLAAFYWLPSMMERKFTLIDSILLTELANYKIHFVYPRQFWYSPWGFGGSIEGPADGISYALGKVHIGLVIASVMVFFLSQFLKRKRGKKLQEYSIFYILYSIFLLLSLFMTTKLSSPIWDNIAGLAYLQFPWRFLTFTGVFISLVGGYSVYFLYGLLQQQHQPSRLKLLLGRSKVTVWMIAFALSTATIVTSQKYFFPQRYLDLSDQQATTADEIAWRVSRTSFEFIPKGVKTTKSELNTTIPAITHEEISSKPYKIITGDAQVAVLVNNFHKKVFQIDAKTPVSFRLNTYNFPGWKAHLNQEDLTIQDANNLKLITVDIPEGQHTLSFKFSNTPVRSIANGLSMASLAFILVYLVRRNYLVSLKR